MTCTQLKNTYIFHLKHLTHARKLQKYFENLVGLSSGAVQNA